jgi:ferric enterobactin receptor
VYTFSPAGYQYLLDDKQSYTSNFRRNVYAAYLSGTFKAFNYLDVIAGIRWEHTVNNAKYSNVHAVVIPDYNNTGPSLTIAHTFPTQQTLRFSYAYRLERPEYRDLNPFVNLADPHNISTGNPNIKPEIGNDFQLGYNYNFGRENNLNIILLYNYNSPDIKSYTMFYPTYQVGDSIYENVNLTRRSNIASEHRFGLNLSGSFNAASKFTIRPGIQLYRRTTNNIYASPVKVTGFEYRATLNANYQFNHGLVAEAFGNYRSGIKWQGRQAAFSTYSIAIKQQLFKGKGSFGFVTVNAFSKYFTQKSTQQGTGFTAATTLHIPYRSFGITFMYKFGKIKIKQKEDDNYLTKPPVEN